MATSEPISPRSIGQMTSECIASLRQLGAQLRDSEGLAKPGNQTTADRIGDSCDRLSLWSQDVGAQDGRLEGLLALSSSLRIHTLNLLDDLTAQILEIMSIEDEDAIEEINDIIGSLFHLEPALIDPAPLDRCSSPRESPGLGSAMSVASDSYPHKEDRLNLVGERRRATSKKPDVDIIAVSGFFGLSSWLPDGQLYDGELADTWLATLLPDILEENGIYARILHFSCKPPRLDYIEPLFLKVQANELVKQVSTKRITDPARPLFFLSHSFGGIFAKQAICTLIDEGLSVNPATPVCGCLFFSVPHEIGNGPDSVLRPWCLSLSQSSRKAQFRRWGPHLNLGYIPTLQRMVLQVNKTYKKKETRYNIPAINYFEPSCRILVTQSGAGELLPEKTNALADHLGVARFSRDQREYILPAVHRIAKIIETASAEWQNEIASDFKNFPAIVEQQVYLKRQRENPFAMLAGYNTAVLINDCFEMLGPKWGAVVDIVRDLVDVITDYDTEDVDIQLSHQAVRSFSVNDGMQASKLLSRVRPAGNEWNLESQLDRYIAKYLKSKSSRLANGNLRPVNMIILTTGTAPRDDSFEAALERIVDRLESESSLDLRMQIVQLEDSLGPTNSFTAFPQNLLSNSGLSHFSADQWAARLQRSNKSQTSALNIAPVHFVNIPYVSDAAVCQRILLGAITNRFHEVPTLSDHGKSTVLDTDTMSASADTGSVTDAGHRKPREGAFSYASSMTSGGIHSMEESECKSHSFDGGIHSLSRSSYTLRAATHAATVQMTTDEDAAPQGHKYGPHPSPSYTVPAAVGAHKAQMTTDDNTAPQGHKYDPSPHHYRSVASLGSFYAQHPYTVPTAVSAHKAQISTDDDTTTRGHKYGISPHHYRSVASSYASAPDPPYTMPAAVGAHEAQMTIDDDKAPQGHKHGPSPHRDPILNLPIENSQESTLNLTNPIESSPAPQRSSSSAKTHQAIFQCNLCPKKFTRSYNLLRHLRSHTSDRPFVCSVCHKAFARQHDRKRHESLHSGEKKLICRGELSAKAGQTWGCGRRFARAEALGRHFRSEAGQICIKPLVDEEKAERKKQTGEIGTQSLEVSPYVSAFNFPAALIAQYPALATIDWTAIEPEKVDFDPGELSDINVTDH